MKFKSSSDDQLPYGTGEEQNVSLLHVYDELCKMVRKLSDLPLTITSMQGTAPCFRYAEVGIIIECKKLTLFASSKYLLSGINGSKKSNIPGSTHWCAYNSLLTTHCQNYDQLKFHMVKGINSAFDHM